jgi:hypothetical protein
VALYKLAILDARDGRIAPAAERLAGMIRRFDARAVATQPVSPPRSRLSVFERSPAAEALGVDARALVLEAKRLEEMLRACAADVPRPAREVLAAPLARPDEPLHPAQLLMRLDETHPAYEANLEGIVQAFSESVTAGFVEVRLVLLEPAVSRRLRRFENTAMAMGSSPAGAEALYRLAEALQEDSLLGVARAAYEQLLREHADSCWAAEAKERLSALAMLESVASR